MTRIRQWIYRNEEALCHMDSYCKLVSYGFDVHAIICWATHYIVACELTTSKESYAIFNTYAQAVRRFARPKHIRSDNAPKHNEVERDRVLQLGASYVGHQHITRIMLAVGGKDIENVPGPFLSNIEGATLSKAHGTVRNQAFFMHQEGLNLDEQYLLHLDLIMECAMADVAGVDLPLYIESALPITTPVKQGVLEKLYLAILGEN
ncbi:hypothetical protein SELMODRAFT_421051 [Selaginella moellendorffii]|uniref:Integrase core domain-containing protein n=1 Tax=Selaginella moellendorffii TaxID=88036 RepID=D8SDZ4_SELML|nr:hypothetical protein SELMODRAFT_421051 [Selaginella moellendorffii]